jgi:hypothetical protein
MSYNSINSTLYGAERSASRPVCLNPGTETSGTEDIGEWVCFGVGPGDLEKRNFC